MDVHESVHAVHIIQQAYLFYLYNYINKAAQRAVFTPVWWRNIGLYDRLFASEAVLLFLHDTRILKKYCWHCSGPFFFKQAEIFSVLDSARWCVSATFLLGWIAEEEHIFSAFSESTSWNMEPTL